MADESQQFLDVQPIFGVTDTTCAAAYYDQLGFSTTVIDSNYAIARRDAVEIHLQWNEEAGFKEDVDQPMYRFLIRDVDALFAEYAPLGVFHDRTALRETPWGTREFAFYDPDGNGLTFYRPLTEDE
jgi:hypothetical protein